MLWSPARKDVYRLRGDQLYPFVPHHVIAPEDVANIFGPNRLTPAEPNTSALFCVGVSLILSVFSRNRKDITAVSRICVAVKRTLGTEERRRAGGYLAA